MKPQLQFEVDEDSAAWSTDGLPLSSVQSPFLANDHAALEAALGRDNYAAIMYRAGYKSARYWCEKDAKSLGLSGMAVFEHYLEHLSHGAWGRFSLVKVDPVAVDAEIRLDHSPFVLAQGETCAAKHCHMFSGWFAGAMDWVRENADEASVAKAPSVCVKTQCGAEGHSHCIFAVRAKPPVA